MTHKNEKNQLTNKPEMDEMMALAEKDSKIVDLKASHINNYIKCQCPKHPN